MSDSPSSILPLPPEVVAQIKSSTAIPSLASVVFGLLANSLDAKANKIDIVVDFRRGTASVEDDGQGIPPNEFTETGGLGKPYREEILGLSSKLKLMVVRHVQKRKRKCFIRQKRDLFNICGCFVNPNNYITPSCSRKACYSNTTSLQASCEIVSSALPP
jgi:hypothetical protein